MNAVIKKSLHVLLVDDNPDDRDLVRGKLRGNFRQKYVFTEVATGKEALDYLNSNELPDCMIMDVSMPRMTGNEVLNKLAKDRGSIPLPIIVLTGSAENEDRNYQEATEAIALGAQDYVTKNSVETESLARAVNNAIERYRLHQELKENEEQYRLAAESAKLGTWSYIPLSGRFNMSGRGQEILGLSPEANTDLDAFLNTIYVEDREKLQREFFDLTVAHIEQGFTAECRLAASGLPNHRWIALRARAQKLATGDTKIIGTVLDITLRKYAEAQRQEEMEMLDALYKVAQSFAENSDRNTPMQLATDIATQLTGAEFGAFFYNVTSPDGQSYMLYTLSGVSREAFSKFPMPRNTAVFAPTFSGEDIIRSDDIRLDARYGKNNPHNGMPKGHLSVVSYLAVPVIAKGGEVLGGIFLGHGKPAIFNERAERIAKAIAAQVAVGIENARLFEELKANEQRFRNLAEAMPQLVWIDRASDGYCEYLSSQWSEYTGIETSKLLGFEWLKLLHPDDQEMAAAAWKSAVEDRAPYNIEYRIRRHDGLYRWFKTRGVPIRDPDGRILIWYGTCTDIQELVESRDAAQAASIAKSEFLANMSHEIRTPMNAVVGLANLLSLSNPLTERQKECVQTLRISADALMELINDLLDIAKIEAHSIELEETPFSVVKVVEEVLSIMEMKAKEKGLNLKLDDQFSNTVKPGYVGDPTRVKQVIMNLCSNALKFTEQGGVTICIEAANEPENELMKISVRDTGIGISPQKTATIFEKFVQADSSINRQYGGTGLGLTITKTLVELMGGKISVESALGQGSKFFVSLPLKRHSSNIHIGQHVLSDGKNEEASNIARPRILLVEDYPANILVASSFLEQFGYECHVVKSGIAAVEATKNNTYAVILMDVQMPHMNGLEATAAIRKSEKSAHKSSVPIIGMTAHALVSDRQRCLDAGMNDYISKPFDPDHLKRLLQHYSRKAAFANGEVTISG